MFDLDGTLVDTIALIIKPDPDPLLLAAQRLGVAPEHAAYVGDAVVDLQAARPARTSSNPPGHE